MHSSAASVQLPTAPDAAITRRAEELFQAQSQDVFRRTDRLFALLLVVQWLAGIVAAWVVAPRTWTGTMAQTHIHVYAAMLLGGLISALPIALALLTPGTVLTRHAIAIGQMLFSSLLIHLTGGRIETHFHVFGSLAFLAVYRDWKVLGTASIVVAADHLIRGIFWPESVYGVVGGAEWRWLEHAGWVLFEDLFLVAAMAQGLAGMRSLAERQAMLETAKHIVEEADRAKTVFLAHVSHEIRTPMTAILGYADLMAVAHQRPEERAEAVQIIRRNGEHLLAVLNDVLDMSKIEAGHLSVERIEFNPIELVCDVASLMRSRAAAKGIELKVRFLTAMPQQITSDPTRLRQVLLNLLSNAIKFTHEGEVRVDVKVIEGAASKLHIAISDTGIGMTADQCRALFKPYAQGEHSTTRRFGGTGLGLAISKRLTENLGGEITVESEAGKGSTFTITLTTGPLEGIPTVEMDGEFVRRPPPPLLPATNTPPAPTLAGRLSGRVLLAEDSTDNRQLLKRLLEKSGLFVEAVADGAEAVKRAMRAMKEGNGDSFDLILMDMQMPEVDGYQATTQLRESGYRAPIVALTAHASLDDRDKCLAAGCDSYVAKPYDLDDLLNCIQTQIDAGHEQGNGHA